MKTFLSTLTLSALITTQFASIPTQAAAPTTPPAVQLEMSCKLVRRYLDPNGNVATQDLTPASLKAQPVKVADLSSPSRSVPMTTVKFKAQSPDGEIEVVAHGSAIDYFAKEIGITLAHAAELVDKAVSVSNPNSFGPNFTYPVSGAKYKSTLQFAVGRTPQGFVVNQYFSICSIESVP